MRAVLDANVLISSLLSRQGASASLVRGWLNGEFELVVSPKLLEELSRALAYPRLAARLKPEDSVAFVRLLRNSATLVPDPLVAPQRSRDPGDDYLIALAESAASVLVTGDEDLLSLAPGLPILGPADFARRLRGGQ